MALLNIFDIAGSAMAAQSKRMNVAPVTWLTPTASPARMVSRTVPSKWFSRWMLLLGQKPVV